MAALPGGNSLCDVAALTLSLSQRERAKNALPLWGRDREREWPRLRGFPWAPCPDAKSTLRQIDYKRILCVEFVEKEICEWLSKK
jgi:hypothetical protein